MTRETAKIKVELLDNYLSHTCQDYGERDHEAMMMAIESLEKESTNGHWIKGYTFPDGAYWKCDKCNELIKVKIPMHYCNNCGADMREVEE